MERLRDCEDSELITELRDDYGRSTGYTYANNGAVQQTVSTGYGEDGRIVSAWFVHGGVETVLWLLAWDPTQTTATSPLAIQINGIK